MNRALEHFELLHLVDNEQFFVTFLDMPFKVTDNTVRHYVDQLRRKVLEPLHEVYGVDVSDDALRKAVAEHNEVCRILTEIGETRKLDNPPITGYEYAVLVLVSYVCPKRLILPMSLRPRSTSMLCSARSFSSFKSPASSSLSSSLVFPLGLVPANGKVLRFPASSFTRVSGDAPAISISSLEK